MRCETCGTEYDPATYEACPECAKASAEAEPRAEQPVAPVTEAPAEKPHDVHGHDDHPAKRSPGCLMTFLVMLPLLLLLAFFLWVLVGAAMRATFGG